MRRSIKSKEREKVVRKTFLCGQNIDPFGLYKS
jgi:hypothetical protein